MSTSALITALKPLAALSVPEDHITDWNISVDESSDASTDFFIKYTDIRAARAAIQEAEAPVPESDARQQARAQVESIVALVAALNCDYDRLEELREERDAVIEEGDDAALVAWRALNDEELAGLEEAAGSCTSREQAEDRIREDALSVDVRSGWQNAGETLEPSEFRIVLCTGGPQVEITGELSQGEPSRAWIEYRDWNESGDLTGNQDDLLAYAACFYFGE